jgi:hypothetical protein
MGGTAIGSLATEGRLGIVLMAVRGKRIKAISVSVCMISQLIVGTGFWADDLLLCCKVSHYCLMVCCIEVRGKSQYDYCLVVPVAQLFPIVLGSLAHPVCILSSLESTTTLCVLENARRRQQTSNSD